MGAAEVTIGLVAAVAALALVLKWFSGSSESSGAGEAGGDPEPGSGELVALSSDGIAFLPRGRSVALVPAEPGPDDPPPDPAHKPGTEILVGGDLIAARVRRGAPDHDPWRLEALGRDREYRAWRFETEEAARAALALLDGRTVRAPRDEDGEPASIGDDDFERARRLEEETERRLAAGEPDDED